MSDALNILYQIYDQFINLVFNTLELFPNVTVGWIAITCFVFGILFRNILALPNKSGSIKVGKDRSNKDGR